MGNFVSKDPRGYCVVLTEDAWIHASAHADLHQGQWSTVTRALASPDLILDNPSIRVSTRTAHERYIAAVPALGGHLVIPTKILQEPEKVMGYGTVLPGTRLAVTIYVVTELPAGTKIWVKP